MGLREFSKKQALRNSITSIPIQEPEQQQDEQYYEPIQEQPHIAEKETIEDDEELVREKPRRLAAMIKRKPSPKEALKVNIGGRPIDLHQLEKYLVWQTSPYILRTIIAYNNSRQIEQMQNYRRKGFSQVGGATKKGSGRLLMWLIIFGALFGIGVVLVMYMPAIMNFFRGFGGAF